MFTTKLGLDITEAVVQKALKLLMKGLSLTHILAEILLYVHLKLDDYEYISIEETVGAIKCDVYAKQGLNDVCIEIETNVVPMEYVLDGYRYIIAKHVKKLAQISKEGIKVASFAYPLGVIPFIPTELLKNPEARSKDTIGNLFNIARKFFNLGIDDITYLENCILGDIYIYDITTLKVFRIPKNSIQNLLAVYLEILDHRNDVYYL